MKLEKKKRQEIQMEPRMKKSIKKHTNEIRNEENEKKTYTNEIGTEENDKKYTHDSFVTIVVCSQRKSLRETFVSGRIDIGQTEGKQEKRH